MLLFGPLFVGNVADDADAVSSATIVVANDGCSKLDPDDAGVLANVTLLDRIRVSATPMLSKELPFTCKIGRVG